MATFYITDGTDRIELLEAQSGHALAPISSGLGGITAKTHAYDAPVRSAADLRFSERYTLVMANKCTDDLAERFQKLVKMFRRSWQRTNKLRYVSDIYLVEQSSGETNTRYAKVWAIPELNFPHPVFDDTFEQKRAIGNFGISIERGIWRSGIPGVIPTISDLDETDGPADPTQVIFANYQDDHAIDTIMRAEDGADTDILMQLADGERGDTGDFDAVTPVWDAEGDEAADFVETDVDGDLNDAAAAAHDGDVGLELTFDNNTVAYGTLNATAIDQTSGVGLIWFNTNTVEMDDASTTILHGFYDGTDALQWYLQFRNNAGTFQVRAVTVDDAAADQATAYYDLADGWNRLVIMFNQSTGADDGWTMLFIGDDLQERLTGIDNDTKDWDYSRSGMVATTSATFGGSFYFDTVKIDPVGTLFADKLAAMVGQYGYAIPIMDVTDRYGSFTGMNNETEYNYSLNVNLIELTMGVGDSFWLVRADGDGGTNNYNHVLVLTYLSPTSFTLDAVLWEDDGTARTIGTTTLLADQSYDIRIEAKTATGPATNDGYAYFYVDDVEIGFLTDVDDNGWDADELWYGPNAGLDVTTYGLVYLDECRWWVPDSEMFPDPASVDDAYYVGSDEPFWIVPWNLITAGVYTGVTFVYEYSDNLVGWPSLTLGTDLMLYPDDDPFDAKGIAAMHALPGSDWAAEADAVHGITKYWIRIRITAVNSWTTSPAYDDVYNQRTPEIRIPAASLKGDIPPFVLKRLKSPDGGDENNTMCSMSRIVVGAKSRGLDHFVSRLNCGNDGIPAEWDVTYGSDTAAVADPQAPGGDRADCDFALVSTQAWRVRFTGTAMLRYFTGEYRVFLRYSQTSGDAEEISIKLRVKINSNDTYAPAFETGEVFSAGMYDRVLMDLIPGDTLLIPFLEITNADDLDADLIFEIWAEQNSGSASLEMIDLILIPADEWIADLNDPISDPAAGTSALRGLNILDIDSGIIENRTIKNIIDDTAGEIIPVETWSRRSSPIEIEPNQAARLYYLIGHYTDGWGEGPFLSENMQGFLVELYQQACYFYLRGAD